jgi:hypothetical protein
VNLPFWVAVARVPDRFRLRNPHFRRGDFSCDWQANPCPGQSGMSYNFRAGGRGETTASCKVYAEPSTGYAGIAALASRVL